MYKLTLLSLLLMSFLMNAQCTITGKSTIKVLAEETYSVSNETAQCKDCHLWIPIGGNATISGDNRQNTVTIKANSGGRQVLSLAILTQQGFLQCSKNIDIIDDSVIAQNSNNPSRDPVQKVECKIDISDFKEVKYAENIVSFFPIGDDQSYKFIWTITYPDGRTATSNEKVGQFPYTKTEGIKTVQLRVITSTCLRDFTKSYDSIYWNHF
jgi:hypothetical protein